MVLNARNGATRLSVTELGNRRQTGRFNLGAAIGEAAAGYAGCVGDARVRIVCRQPIARHLGARDRGDQQASVGVLRRGHDRLDAPRLDDMGAVQNKDRVAVAPCRNLARLL